MHIPAPPMWLIFGVTVVFWVAVGLHYARGNTVPMECHCFKHDAAGKCIIWQCVPTGDEQDDI